MSFFDHENRRLALGVALGGVAAVAAPFVARVVSPALRALLKGLLTAGMLASERGVEALSRLGEGLEDLLAEARADVDCQLRARGAVARPERKGEPTGHDERARGEA